MRYLAPIVGLYLFGILPGSEAAPIPKNTATKPVLAWKSHPGPEPLFEGRTPVARISADSKRIYLTYPYNGSIEAVSAIDGKRIWIFKTDASSFYRPELIGDFLICANQTGYFAFDQETGKQVWHAKVNMENVNGDPPFCDPVSMRLYGGGSDGYMYCLSMKDGREIWKADLLGERRKPVRVPFEAFQTFQFGITADGDDVFVSMADGRCLAFLAKDGSKLWEAGAKASVTNVPVVDKERVYFGSRDYGFYCVDRKTGKQKWRADIKGWGDSPKASDGQNVYLTVHNLYLKAIEKDTGKLVWSKDHEGLGGRPSQRLAGPVLHHGLLWITDYGTLCGINPKSGKTVQELKIDTKNSYHLPPVVHQDRIYLINEDGLVAIDLK